MTSIRLQQQPGIRQKQTFPLLLSTNKKKNLNDDMNCIICKTNLKGAIWLGDTNAAKNLKALQNNKITAVLTVAKNSGIKYSVNDNIMHRVIQAEDNISYDLSIHFQAISEFIHEQRIRLKNILIHCVNGVSRSVTALISYLMIKEFYSLEEALQICKIHRQIVKPNPGFMRQLMILDRDIFQANQRLKYKMNKKLNQNQLQYNSDNGSKINKSDQQITSKQEYIYDLNQEKYENIQNNKQIKEHYHKQSSQQKINEEEEQDKDQNTSQNLEEENLPVQRSNLRKKSKVLNLFYKDLCNNQMQMSRSLKPKQQKSNKIEIKKSNIKDLKEIDDVEELQLLSLTELKEDRKRSQQKRNRKDSLEKFEKDYQKNAEKLEDPSLNDQLQKSQKILEIQESKTTTMMDYFQSKKEQQKLFEEEQKQKQMAEQQEKLNQQQELRRKQENERQRIQRGKIAIELQNEFDKIQRENVRRQLNSSYKNNVYFSLNKNNKNIYFQNQFSQDKQNYPKKQYQQLYNNDKYIKNQPYLDYIEQQQVNKPQSNSIVNRQIKQQSKKYQTQNNFKALSVYEKEQFFNKTLGFKQENQNLNYQSYSDKRKSIAGFCKQQNNLSKDHYLQYASPKNLLSNLYPDQDLKKKQQFYSKGIQNKNKNCDIEFSPRVQKKLDDEKSKSYHANVLEQNNEIDHIVQDNIKQINVNKYAESGRNSAINFAIKTKIYKDSV
ncbi:hypothetical protein PPERSA_00112 [Pseudocohnilembus persalinus]|uniref:protein-tyrosine-phosphatase n=1 Tax=Pseudocohnilembus persalinus TaxID=266149 RepID=A0A0V0Q8D9_PSEPJ|nr:hypothetical protein PPERSA_00112 [Pseudocohnilembus persalinus]|eukprot:KRW98515.1 hypothetical protein PPERSA_00112 [Pseudocohnilembus persalinus]